ncbi:hypothetical protein DUI87_04564 [Hirundo rustica rustica]|uniref:Uncharacterized protein n=1 Tax=Hirundo rustica rustica TaxID=333673 RepID=A0A3M0KZJ0_HIRRU|nr:hypothetical protein DUI87_04564 [Hirundo rustica rustica]
MAEDAVGSIGRKVFMQLEKAESGQEKFRDEEKNNLFHLEKNPRNIHPWGHVPSFLFFLQGPSLSSLLWNRTSPFYMDKVCVTSVSPSPEAETMQK